MPVLVAALPYIAIAATAASTGVAVAAQVQAGNEQRQAANYKAKELQRNALLAQQQAGAELAAKDQKQQMILSSIRANAAASGVSVGTGSALEAYDTSSEQAQLNDMYTKYAGNIQAQGDIAQSQLTSYGGKTAQQAAYFSAAGDAIAGIGTGLGTYVKYKSPSFQIH